MKPSNRAVIHAATCEMTSLLCTADIDNGIKWLLGPVCYARFGAMQHVWLREVYNTQKVPSGLLRGGRDGLLKFLRKYDSERAHSRKQSVDQLKEAVRKVYLGRVDQLLNQEDRYQIAYNIPDFPSPDHVSSIELLFRLMTETKYLQVRLRLQKVFVLLCGQIMSPPETYQSLLEYCGEWKTQRDRQHLQHAKHFVYRLCQLSKSDMQAILLAICERYEAVGNIPTSEYQPMLTHLYQGTEALLGYLRQTLSFDFDTSSKSISIPVSTDVKDLKEPSNHVTDCQTLLSSIKDTEEDVVMIDDIKVDPYDAVTGENKSNSSDAGTGENMSKVYINNTEDDGVMTDDTNLDPYNAVTGENMSTSYNSKAETCGRMSDSSNVGTDENTSYSPPAGMDETISNSSKVVTGLNDRGKRTRTTTKIYDPSDHKAVKTRKTKNIKKRKVSNTIMDVKTARELLESQGFVVIEKTASKRHMKPKSSKKRQNVHVTSIVDAVRSRQRADLIVDLKFGERCTDCGMLMIDTDVGTLSIPDLNIRLRQENISVCILRSAKGQTEEEEKKGKERKEEQEKKETKETEEKEAKDEKEEKEKMEEIEEKQTMEEKEENHEKKREEEKDIKRTAQDDYLDPAIALGQLGAFITLLDQWKRDGENKRRPRLSRKWSDIEKALSDTKQAMLVLESSSWNILKYVDASTFKRWWTTVVDKIFKGTTWPYECPVSCTGLHLKGDRLLSRLQDHCAKTLPESKDVDELTIHLAFGLLIGGMGSPPHCDTMTNILSHLTNTNGLEDVHVHLVLAVGYLIQGKKYFWALPPKDDYTKKFLDFYRDRPPTDITEEQQVFRDDILNGTIPHPFQGSFSMGWPTETDWDDMKFAGISNHFHPVIAGDRYIVMDGVLHAVCNDVDLQPVSVAHDDSWMGGYSDLATFHPKLGSTCRT